MFTSIGLKNYILEAKSLEEKKSQSDPRKKGEQMAGNQLYVTRRLILKV